MEQIGPQSRTVFGSINAGIIATTGRPTPGETPIGSDTVNRQRSAGRESPAVADERGADVVVQVSKPGAAPLAHDVRSAASRSA